MDSSTLLIIKLAALLLAQFTVTAGMASFLFISRWHIDKVFPGEKRWRWCPRLLHRRRLHFVLSLLLLEYILIILSVILAAEPGILAGNDAAIVTGEEKFISLLIVALAMIGISILGFGLAGRSPSRFALILSYPLFPVHLLFSPLVGVLLSGISRLFPALPEEIASQFFLFGEKDDGRDGFIQENGSRLIHNIVEFGAKKVKEVMIPRIDVFALDLSTELEEVRRETSAVGHSRVPVYQGTIDNIIGILYVKDLVSIGEGDKRENLGDMLGEPIFVPESKKIDDLLRIFQIQKKHIAIVVDEYGGTSGIITLEDILEEIVGEIRDEYDHEIPLIQKTGEREYMVAGWINLGSLNAALNISLPDDKADTLGGFLFSIIERVPEEDETIGYTGINFHIDRLEGQRIAKVLVELPRLEG